MSFKQIKIDDEVVDELDSLKFKNESYNILIKRLLKELDSLKADKEMLMKIVMKTEDSIAFPNINHSVFFAISQVIKDDFYSDDEKLGYLKIYLRPSLEDDSDAVLSMIDSIKNDYDIDSPILNEVTSWIKESYQ